MYKIIHLISVIVRQFVLPNPYKNIISNEIYADLFNIIIGGTIIHFCAFILTGCGYIRGINDPASGSFGYLVSYCYITALITVLGHFIPNTTIFIISFIILYIITCVLIKIIFNKRKPLL